MAVQVPEKVLEGLDAVRNSGRTNMLDRNAVQAIASEMGYHATVVWMEDHRKEYGEGVFKGFEVENENE